MENKTSTKNLFIVFVYIFLLLLIFFGIYYFIFFVKGKNSNSTTSLSIISPKPTSSIISPKLTITSQPEKTCNSNKDCKKDEVCLTIGPIIANLPSHKICSPKGQVNPL